MKDIESEYLDVKNLSERKPQQAIEQLKLMIKAPTDNKENILKVKESAIYLLAELYQKEASLMNICNLTKDIRPIVALFPQAKTAKIIRTLFEYACQLPEEGDLLEDTANDIIQWTNETKRNFLRFRIETRLANLYLAKKKYKDALTLLEKVMQEVKKLDDMVLLVDIHLTETKVQQALENLPKAKASLTAVKTAATTVNLSPKVLADIDLMSGKLCIEEEDYHTGFSYFLEAFQTFSGNVVTDKSAALKSLQYMLLAKIMSKQDEDVATILNSKLAMNYQRIETNVMKEIAKATQSKSLIQFEKIYNLYKQQLTSDHIIKTQIDRLYSKLLEENIEKVIMPFSEVEIEHVAKLLGLPTTKVLQKLSQMIIDKKIEATLDQGNGCLIIFDKIIPDKSFEHSVEIVKNLDKVLDSLYEKTHKLKDM